MLNRFLLAPIIALSICGAARAGEKYSFHEALHVGQKIPFTVNYDINDNTVTTINGVSTTTHSETKYHWKTMMTIQAVKDGSAIQAQVEIDPSSTDTITTDQGTTTTSCSYAEKTVTVKLNPDNTFTNDFSGTVRNDDDDLMNNFIAPDEDYYPDHAISVGDSWDNTAKLAKHTPMGPNDRMLSMVRLDWVKAIDGKPMAQFSTSYAAVYHEEGQLEEDYEATTTFLVDMTRQMIVKSDQAATSQFKTPPTAAAQITGGVHNTFHCVCGD